MTYKDFYKIACFLNECGRENFTPEEIACNAYDYLLKYQESITNQQSTADMKALCNELVEDMDWADYADDPQTEITIQDMEKILGDTVDEL